MIYRSLELISKGIHLKYIIGLLFIVIFAGCTSNDRVFCAAYRVGRNSEKRVEVPTLTVHQVLQEANDSFAYRGKPIHPKLVQEFECWISDLNPVTLAVDVSAARDSNEYADKVFEDNDGYVCIKTADGLYGYKWIFGVDGVHILKPRDFGNGSGSFGTELRVKFEIWQSQYPDGEAYDQLVMRLIR